MLNLFVTNSEKVEVEEERWTRSDEIYSIDVAGHGCLLIATRTNVFFEKSPKFREQNGIIKHETKFSDCGPVCAPDSATNDGVR